TSPQRRSKVEFAKALAQAVDVEAPAMRSAPERPSWWQGLAGLIAVRSPGLQFAGGLAALLCIVGGSWLAVENGRMRSRVAPLEAQSRDLTSREQALSRQLSQEQGRSEGLAAELRKQQSGGTAAAPAIASLVLLPGLSRSQ